MAIQSRKIFMDATVMLSFLDRSDENHLKVIKAIDQLPTLGYQVYTSYFNVVDAYTALSREIGVSVALEFLQSCLQSDMEIIFPQKADLITAHRIIRGNRERQISLKEALNATLMQKRGIYQILTLTYWHNLFGTHVSNLI